MSFRINTNLSAMGALRTLSQNSVEASNSIQRLSTGLRINTGADDPAGLIASESFRAQISGIDQAVRNNQDALNFSKTADGALDEMSRLLREARSLAVANGSSTIDASQKAANQTQLNNIMSSIDRISGNTQFGNRKLLDGSAGVQANINTVARFTKVSVAGNIGGASMSANGTLDVDVTTAATRAAVTGNQAYATAATVVGAGSFTLNGQSFNTTATTTRDELVAMINNASDSTGVTAAINGSNQVVLTNNTYGTDSKVQLTSTAGVIFATAGSNSSTGVDAVATVTYDDGTNTTTAAFDKGKGLELRDSSGNSISLSSAGNAVATNASAIQIYSSVAQFQIGANGGQTASLSLSNMSSSSLGLSGLDISGTSVSTAMASLDAAISTVAKQRASVGSFMRNTLESNIRSLGVAKENLSATESSIREVDIAEEMTSFTKLQILQQSGLSMLAQANSAPQAVLSLLR
jgi:flagellin